MNIKQVAELFQARYDKVVVENKNSENGDTHDRHDILTLYININIIILAIITWVVQKIINNYY